MPEKAKLEEEQQIIEAYLAGASSAEAAALFGYSKTTCLNILRRHNIKPRAHTGMRMVTEAEQEAMITDYQAGLSAQHIARKFGRSMDACFYALNRKGVEPRSYIASRARHYTVDTTFFDNIVTEEQAYWLGFITADGGIHRSHVDITLKATDKLHLIKWLEAMKSNNPITDMLSSEGKSYCRVAISSRKITNALLALGVTERKSLTIRPCEQVPNELKRHYWRGLVDGDGYITYSTKNRTWCAGLVGSKFITEGFREFIANLTNSKAQVLHMQSIFRVTFTGNNLARKVVKVLYEDATVYLERKKNLADHILKG